MGTQRAPASLPCVAALILALAILAITGDIRLYGSALRRWTGTSGNVAVTTGAHDAPVEFFPTHRTEMGDRPDCW